jgi:UV DNA damage endonuclease
MRLGFAVKVLGEGGLKECDNRRWQSGPHLRNSIGYLDTLFDYLDRNDLRMYRMSSGIAPYLTHPDLPQFHRQIEESAAELSALGEKARLLNLRLSLHPSQYIVLNAVDDDVARKSIEELNGQADVLDAMALGTEAVVVTHVGGVYGDREAGKLRWVERYLTLPEPTRRRLVLENDDISYTARDVLWIAGECGVRVVFDNLHHFCNHQPGDDVGELALAALATWPESQTPKIHYSSPRTEAVDAPRRAGKAASMKAYGPPPDLRLHSDYINPFEFVYFLEKVANFRDFDIMIEAKAKDLAALKLRHDLIRLGIETS